MAHIDVVLKNPFRLLGLETNATAREITRASETLCASLRIGATPNGADVLFWAEPLTVTEEMANQARHALQDKNQRDSHDFFWFWFRYPNSNAVRSALAEGNPDRAASMLCADIEAGDAVAAANASHDLGLVRLVAAAELTDLDRVCDDYSRALGLLLASIRQFAKDESVLQSISETVLGILVDHVRSLVDSGNPAGACQLYNVLLDCPYDDGLRKEACSMPFRAYFESLTSRCNEIRRDVNSLDFDNDKSRAAERLRSLCKDFDRLIVSPIDNVTDLCEFYADDIEPVCDSILDCARTLSVALHNELHDTRKAYEVLASVEAFPASESKVQMIQPGLRICGCQALQMRAIDYERNSQLVLAAQKYREASELCDDAEERDALLASATRCELNLLVQQAVDLEKLSEWNAAAAKYREASRLCQGAQRAGLIHSAERCETNSGRRQAAPSSPSSEPRASGWDGYVGSEIRRCALNQLVTSVVVLFFCLCGFGYESYLRFTDEVVPEDGAWAAGFLLLVIAISVWYLRLSLVRRRDPTLHPIARALAQFGPIEDVVASIDGEVKAGTLQLSSLTLTRLWCIRASTFNLEVYRSIDIIWVYKKVTSHSVNSIPTGKSYELVIHGRGYLNHEIKCYGASLADHMLQRLAKCLPWIILGYSKELDYRWGCERDRIVAAVDERRRQTEPFLELLYPDHGQAGASVNNGPHARPTVLSGKGGPRKRRVVHAIVGVAVALAFAGFAYLWFTVEPGLSDTYWAETGSRATSADSSVSDVASDSDSGTDSQSERVAESAASDTSESTGTVAYTPPVDHSAEIESLQNSIDEADQQLSLWRDQLQSWRSEMGRLESSIQALRYEKQSIERASEMGEYVDEQRYDSIVDEANSLVGNYNAVRAQHNDLVRRFNSLVRERNADVKRAKALAQEDQ